ncbi:PIN domain-containing protein [Lysinibacillus sp. NPDC094403]|uniref:PIN domain-containing protein n=1 Tax=Lysinibacillus sp. NPDC094403 TaxID=3390581 RepID=UPI003D03CC4E
MKRKGKVFIDANILIAATDYKIKNVFEWIDALYDEVYVHQMVYDELLLNEVKQNVDNKLTNDWILFDPDDESTLSDDMYEIYERYLDDVKQGFSDLDEKKEKEGRPLKHTNDLGEIHSLAAAMLLGASIIFSNDYDILEVIHDSELCITIDEDKKSELIQHDSLVDFCFYLINSEIESKAIVRKFLKAIQKHKVEDLDERLNKTFNK